MLSIRSFANEIKTTVVNHKGIQSQIAHYKCFATGISDDEKQPVNLAYEVYDKYKSHNSFIIAHGLFASKFTWRSLAKAINEKTKHKVYTIDLRNHGDSKPFKQGMDYVMMANDIKHFIDNVVLKEASSDAELSCMGHSMGGKTFMTYALMYPNTIQKLIVGDVSPNRSPSYDSISSYSKMMMAIKFDGFTELHLARAHADKLLSQIESLQKDKAMKAFLLTRIGLSNSKIEWLFNLDSIGRNICNIMEFPEFSGKVSDVKTLFLGGDRSNYITEKDEPDIKKHFSNYRIVKIKNAGHVMHLDNPRDTMQEIDKFLNEI